MSVARMWTTAPIPDLEFGFESESEYFSVLASIPHKDTFVEGDKIWIYFYIKSDDCHEEYPCSGPTTFTFYRQQMKFYILVLVVFWATKIKFFNVIIPLAWIVIFILGKFKFNGLGHA